MLEDLPPPRSNQAFFSVSALEAGILRFPIEIFLDPEPVDCPPNWAAPSLCFLLRHSASGEYILFDNGVRKDMDKLPPVAQSFAKHFGPVDVRYGAADRVAAGGLDPARVKQLIISHIHFDHTGDTSLFPNATIVVGKSTYDFAQLGYPAYPDSPYEQDLLPEGRTRALDPDDPSLGWQQLGPFDKALDLLGDGSAYIIDAPGHVLGHINLIVRTSADGAWAYFAGDSAHDWRIVHGECTFATRSVVGCMMKDAELANRHVARMRTLGKIPRVKVFLAHDVPMWEQASKNDWEGFWPKTIASL